MMKTHIANQQRLGFTLVELLVSISIFVILLTIAVGAIDLSSGNRGLSSGANQLQSAIEGARSRAAKLQRNVGLRFVLNDRVDNSPASAEIANTSYIEYVAAPESIICRATIIDSTPANIYDNSYEVEFGPPFSDPAVLTQMVENGIFTRGVKIHLYKSDINNPTVVNTDYGIYQFTDASNPQTNTFYISPPLKISDTVVSVPNLPSPGNSIILFAKITFDAMAPLPNEQPIQLAKDVVIDWKSSKVPREWGIIKNAALWDNSTGKRYNKGDWIYPDISANNTKRRYFKCIDFGTPGTSEPNWDSIDDFKVIKDNTVYWQAYPQPTFDLVFNPRGDIAGSIASNGVIHFVLASKDDALQGRSLYGDGGPTGQTDNELNFEREHRILTMFTQTGYTSISPANLTDTNNDNAADDPYRYALEGVEAK